MRKIIVTLDENLSNLLAKETNQSATVRKCLNIYYDDISPDRIAAIGTSYKRINDNLAEIDEKVTYLTEQIDRLVTKIVEPF